MTSFRAGWHYSKLTDVIVGKVGGGGPSDDDDPSHSANLVFSDGCRNPKYRIVAPNHPSKDPVNSLVNNFGFRAFMFQNMKNGDSIKISAKVTACVEAIDCAPVSVNVSTYRISFEKCEEKKEKRNNRIK